MTEKEAILNELEEIPEAMLGELHDFIRFLKQKASGGAERDAGDESTLDRLETAVISESSLGKDWLRPEEDEAWRYL